MSAGEYIGGLALLVAVAGACAVATLRLLAPRGVSGLIGASTVWSALLVFVHVAPLALGVLSRGTVLVTAALALTAAVVLGRRVPVGDAVPGGGWGVPATVAGVVLAGAALASLEATAGRPFTGLDALNFQLPQVARWIQTGTLWRLDQYIVDYSNTTYPHTGNVVLLAATLPWHSAFAAGLAPVPFYVLAALGAMAAAEELGAPRRDAAAAAVVLAAVPVLARSGLQGALSDAPMLAWLAAGVLFLLRHARTGARSDLVLAGLGLGLAFGTKWYAVTAVPLVLVVWLVARRPGRAVLPLAAVVAAAGGIWLVRNWVETGNPLFPQPLLGLFPAPPDPLRAAAGFSLAHYAFDLEVWRTYLRPSFAVFLGPPGLLLAAGTLTAAGAAARARVARVLAVAVATAGLALLYGVTPYSALGPEGSPTGAGVSTRYALPALLGGAVLLGWALGRTRTRWARIVAGIVLVLAVADGARRAFPGLSGGKVTAGMLVVLAMGAAARRPPPRRVLAVAAVALALLGGDALRRRANGSGYGGADPALAFVEARAPAGHRVGIAGRWTIDGVSPVLPAFGPRLGNEVRYVGPYVEGMLRVYRAGAPFRAALRAGGFDLLVVGRADSRGRPAREEGWARNAGWRPVTASPRLALLAAPARDTLPPR